MKYLVSAIALVIASPALAQTAPANPHAAHQTAPAKAAAAPCTPEHAKMGHCKMEKAGMDGGCCDKDANGKMACCEKAKAAGKKMPCCDKDKKADAAKAGKK